MPLVARVAAAESGWDREAGDCAREGVAPKRIRPAARITAPPRRPVAPPLRASPPFGVATWLVKLHLPLSGRFLPTVPTYLLGLEVLSGDRRVGWKPGLRRFRPDSQDPPIPADRIVRCVVETLVRDVRSGLKILVQEKTFSATVLLTLAVCIGANVAIFSVIHRVLLEPLPFHEADRLVTVFNRYPGAGAARGSNGSVDFFQRRENVDAFQEVAAFQGSGNTVGEVGSTEQVSSMRVTPSFFPLLGVQAAVGRTFTEDEMEVGNHHKVVLTHGYWQEYFGGAPDVVGRELRVDARPYTVVGVLPRDFVLPERANTRFFLPIAFTEEQRQLDAWHSNNYEMMARLRPGATVEQARAQNEALNQALIDQWPLPNARQLLEDVGYSTGVFPTQEDMLRDARAPLYMLWAGVAFVLLIGCVNIANLMLARAQTRVTEVATRLALGAARVRVARQVLTEAVVMGLVGGTAGIGLGAMGIRMLLVLGADDLPMGTEIGLSTPVVLFTAGLAVGAGVLFGSIPMVQIMRGDLTPVFRTEGRTGTASRRAVLLRNGLVTSQVALAFVMLIGAGLLLVSFRSALDVDPGFDPEDLLTAFVSLPTARYEDGEARRQFTDELLREIRALPGVESAGVTSMLPFTGNNSSSVIMPEWYEPTPGESLLSPLHSDVGPGYFQAMGIELLEGRFIDETDGPDATNGVVLDRWLANRYWPDRSPLGDRVIYGAVPGMDSIPEDALYTVVGVVETIKQNDLTAPESEHVGAYYFSIRQRPRTFMTLVVRAAAEATGLTPGIRAALNRIDPELPLFGVETMGSRIDESLAGRRVPMMLLGVFAGVALFLAMVGIYGALAYSVSQRRREIGIRMAMGSAPADAFRRVVGQGMRVTALGLVIGVVAALGLTRLMQSLLFGVEPTDLRVLVAVTATLAGIGLLACLVPARRATAVDPVRALSG
jgi:predicted permease